MTTDQSQPGMIWRIKLRSPMDGVQGAEQQVRHCRDNDLIGCGWGMGPLGANPTLPTILKKISSNKAAGWGTRAAAVIRRFGSEAKDGEFVWTRDTHGLYLLCMLNGPFRYESNPAANAVDVHQVRDVIWAPREFNELEVPGGVIRAFVGIGSSFSRIHDVHARRLTAYLWEKAHGRPLPELGLSPLDVLTSHLDPYDVEDIVYIWLQVEKGYIALPRARQRDNPNHEFPMIHRGTRRRGIVQIKSGATAVDLEDLEKAAGDQSTDVFAYSTSGAYTGRGRAQQITNDELLSFVAANPDLLPPRVRLWFDLAN